MGCPNPSEQGARYFIPGASCLKELLTLSTILNALRKIERETAQRAQQPSSMADNALARVLAKKRRRKAFRRAVITIALVLLVGTGVTITLGYRSFSSKDNVSPPKVAEVPRKDKEIKAPTVPVRQKEEAPKPEIVAKKPAPEPEKLIKKEEPIPLPSGDETVPPVTAKTLQKPAPEPEALTKKEEPTIPPPRTKTALPVTTKALQKPAPQIPPRPSSQVETRRSEAVIRDLELQAIVWSEDPESRSAMIDGRLVRLGGEVGGFTVDDIGRNYVSVKSGLRSGRLRMIGAR